MAHTTIEGLAGGLVWTEGDRFPPMARFYRRPLRRPLGRGPRPEKPDCINCGGSGVRLSGGVHAGVRGASREPLRVMLNLTVADIQAAHARLAAAGVAFSRAPEREEWGGWVATF